MLEDNAVISVDGVPIPFAHSAYVNGEDDG
jgi:hypothetical protein